MTPTRSHLEHSKRVEILARYLYSRDGDEWPRSGWDEEREPFKQGYRDEATNVLRAMDEEADRAA